MSKRYGRNRKRRDRALRAKEAQQKETLLAQVQIYLLTRPFDVVYARNGPSCMPFRQELRGPMQWHRYYVHRNALDPEANPYDEMAGLKALELDVDTEAIVQEQCDFIRDRTAHFMAHPLWPIPADVFDASSWASLDVKKGIDR
jgi:hypothetical protein